MADLEMNLGLKSMNTAPTALSRAALESQYWQLRLKAAAFPTRGGVLKLSGEESKDFLQRLSTNDMAQLAPASPVRTVLTNEKGRVIDLCTVLEMNGFLLILTSPGHSQLVRAWLEKFVIMEDITIADLSSSMTTSWLVGPEVQSVLRSAPELANFSKPGELPGHSLLERGGLIVAASTSSVPFFEAIAGKETMENLLESQRAGDAGSGIRIVDVEAFGGFCIEQGVPRFGIDFTEENNPLEASLRPYISFSKGCYIGQEVIARIDTYAKLQKQLHGMIIDADETPLAPGALWSGEELVGRTTSHAWSFGLGRQIALGYVRNGFEDQSLQYTPERSERRCPVRLSPFPLFSPGAK